jgi:hypothetical protein
MKVRVSYTVVVDDEIRRAIARYHGQEGLASRDEIKQWYEMNGLSMDDDLSLLSETNDENAD